MTCSGSIYSKLQFLANRGIGTSFLQPKNGALVRIDLRHVADDEWTVRDVLSVQQHSHNIAVWVIRAEDYLGCAITVIRQLDICESSLISNGANFKIIVTHVIIKENYLQGIPQAQGQR